MYMYFFLLSVNSEAHKRTSWCTRVWKNIILGSKMIRYHPQQRGTPRTLWEAKAEKQNNTKVPHYAATTDTRGERRAIWH